MTPHLQHPLFKMPHGPHLSLISLLSHILHLLHPLIKNRKQGMADDDKKLREQIFKRFDANGDGKISATELGEALKQLGAVSAEEVHRMMAEIDTNGDGYISYQEFTVFYNDNRGLMKDVAKIFVDS